MNRNDGSGFARSGVKRLFIAALVAATAHGAVAQPTGELGRPYFRNFAPSEYDAHVWNSSAVEDGRGVLYVGNNDGLLEYDGVSWRLVVLPGRSHVSSLGRDADGRIWVGGFGDLGFLAPDSLGRTVFVSIRRNLPPGTEVLTFVERTVPAAGAVYFATRTTLLRYRPDPGNPANGTVERLLRHAEGIGIFGVDGQVLVWQQGIGLARLDGDAIALLAHGSRFASEAVQFVLARGDGTLLVGTAGSGLFLVDDAGASPFGIEAKELLATHRITSGAALSEGRYALGTRTGGVLVIDGSGRPLFRIDSSIGLQHDAVKSLHADGSGSLWVMLERGISRLDVDSPFTHFDEALGLEDLALKVIRHGGRLYVGTTSGLSVLDTGTGTFRRVPEIPSRTVGFLPVGEELLVATASGVFRIGREGAVDRLPAETGGAFMLARSATDPDLVFVGFESGIRLLCRDGASWRDLGRVNGVEYPVHTGAGLEDGTVWIVDDEGTAFRLRPVRNPVLGPADVDVRAFGPEEGLPAVSATVYEVGGRPYFTSFGAAVWGLDDAGDRVVRVHTFDELGSGYPLDWFGFHEDAQGRVWAALGNRGMSRADPMPDGTYRANPGPLRRLGSVLVIEIFPEPDGVVWMAGSDGLIRYDTNRPLANPGSRSALIRRVVVRGDSLLHAGLGPPPPIEMAHARNSVRIEYALPGLRGANEYRTMLEGYDEDWSAWSPETDRTYTNLPEKDYTFRVRARDIDGVESGEGQIAFTVLPPWHRTIWAYLLFAMAGFAGVYALRRYEMGRMRMRHRIELQHVEAERLRDLDRVRTDFFANISHEFRTPLTLILGPVADALERRRELTQGQLSVLHRNAQRLLRLINQILDLSKLEAGGMTLHASREDIVPFLSGLLYSFESVAERRGIGLTMSTTRKSLHVLFERDRLEQVFLNLFSNAIKFTPDGGSVTVACGRSDGYAEITVSDTGCGIPADRLPHIFDRYFQSGLEPAREKEGTGIGLALTRALVELHRGEITVGSEVGAGTTFTVRLPVGEDADPGDAGDGAVGPRGEAGPGPDDDPEDGRGEAGPEVGDGRPIVLVVEDHPDVRGYVRECLAADYDVREAVDGADGLTRAQALVPDLIVVDVMMPNLDGYGLSRALRADERTSHVPIVMLTARAAQADKLEGLETGVDDYLLKPFNPQELRLRVRNLIAQREAARRRFSTATVIRASEVAATSIDRAFLERVVAIVEERLADEQFTVDRLASDVGMSVSQLNRKLNALIDQAGGSLLRSMRLQRAADLLAQRAGSVSEIAYRVGFSNPAHFSTAFKKQFDVPPSAYGKES